MSSTSQLVEELKLRLKTTQPIVWIQTDEPSRAAAVIRNTVLDFVKAAAARRQGEQPFKYELFEHDVANGMRQLTRDGALIKNDRGQFEEIGEPVEFFNPTPPPGVKWPRHNFVPDAPWRFLTDLISSGPAGGIFLCHNFAEIVDMRPNAPHARAMMRNALLTLTGLLSAASDVKSFKTTGRILIATGRLPDAEIARPEILDTFDILRLDRPDDTELCDTVTDLVGEGNSIFVQKNAAIYHTEKPDEQIARAVRNLKGLTAFSAETAALRTICATRYLDPVALTKQRKTLIERCPGLQLIEPSTEFDWNRVKGLDNLETLVKRALGPDVPEQLRVRSMTVFGPPGTGKSMFAKALSNYLAVPLVFLNIGQLMDKYIGESQKMMTLALATLDSIGDFVLVIDEADKQLDGLISDGGNRGDSGVGSQVMQLLLSWEQERLSRGSRGIVVKTANRPNNLKAESQRAGRNDVTFFVDFPHKSARREILQQYLKDYGLELPANELEAAVSKTRYWSGAELKELVRNYGRFGSMAFGFEYVRPVVKMMSADVAKMRSEGAEAGVPASKLSVDKEDDQELASLANSAVGKTARFTLAAAE